MIRLPSLFRPYDAYVSVDPALKPAPELPSDATDEQRKASAEYIATLVSCIDTGDWSALLIPGQTPLKFVLQHLDRTAFRSLIDRMGLPENNARHIGEKLGQALLVRLALVDIVGAEGLRVRREADPQWDGWVMAQSEVIQILDAADPRIVGELALGIQRKAVLGPKS